MILNRTKNFQLSILALLMCVLSSYAQDTLYINRDTTSIFPVFYQKTSFNWDTVFNAKNALIDIVENESLELVIFNTDTVQHEVLLPDGTTTYTILAGQSELVAISPLSYGTYVLQSLSPQGYFLGAGAVVRSGISGIKYAWDLWDQDPELTHDFGNGTATEIPPNYRPLLFTINGSVQPMSMTSGAMIMGSVGDTITISIVNNGNMIHPMHFHGYHIEIMQSTHQPEKVGWLKDSFPVYVKEGITVRLIPHQPGEFPVHNHNLIATLFNNGTPLGMATMIMITP